MRNRRQRTRLPTASGLERSWSHVCRIRDQDGEEGEAAMDDLDRLSLEVAIGILQAEMESPGSQRPASIEMAKQILTELRWAEWCVEELSTGHAFDYLTCRSGSD